MAHGLAGMAADEIERAVMGPAELVALELLVRFEREVAIGIEHQLYALAQFLVAQEQRISGRSGFHHAGNKYRSVPIVVRSPDYSIPRSRCCGASLPFRHNLAVSRESPMPLGVAQRLVLDLDGRVRQVELAFIASLTAAAFRAPAPCRRSRRGSSCASRPDVMVQTCRSWTAATPGISEQRLLQQRRGRSRRRALHQDMDRLLHQ